MKIILGLVGDLAAGKGTISDYVQSTYGCTTYRFSTMLRDILDRIYVEKNRENLQELSTFLRQKFGQDVMSKVIAKDVEADKKNLVIVDGIRRPTDITYLEKIPGFSLVYVTADSNLRWQRLVARKENPGDEKKTYAEFLHDEQAEADQLIQTLGSQAKVKIINNGTKQELFAQVESILQQLK